MGASLDWLRRRIGRQSKLAVRVAPGLEVWRRDAWAGGVSDPGALPTEAPGGVRVLIVHHSATTNLYGEDEVVDVLQSLHRWHTAPKKGWPDVAYNFLVDRFGRVWEGRSGSLAGPVIGDATGGNQGFSQLVCLIGDFEIAPPTAEAVDSLVRVLAWLADRYAIDPSPRAMNEFVSRGSDRWPKGATIRTTTVAGHRDMSYTACPGDAAYAIVRGPVPSRVAALVASQASIATGARRTDRAAQAASE